VSLTSASTGLLMQTEEWTEGWIGSWSPGIGDPTVAGWITVFAYLVTAYLCWRVFRRIRDREPGAKLLQKKAAAIAVWLLALLGRGQRLAALPVALRSGALWWGLAVVLLLLGINKQLDLQTAFTETGRILAFQEGWYRNRRVVQVAFICCVGLAGIWGFVATLRLMRGNQRHLRGVLLGTIFLICFVAIRASSFHHVDLLLGHRLGGLKINWVLELGGISFIALAAYRNGALTARRSSRPARPAGAPQPARRQPPQSRSR
jgi:hypothetical protein